MADKKIMVNAVYDGEYTLIITNYPCPMPVGDDKPLHEYHILPGRQQRAYFVGSYQKCVEQIEAFKEDLNRFVSNNDLTEYVNE